MVNRNPSNITEWSQWLNSLVNYEKILEYNYRLNDYRRLMKTLGSPEKKLNNVILIAGTKGKGSTAAILDACLQAHGYKTGRYSSPHLMTIRERITINGRPISEKDIAEQVKALRRQFQNRHLVGARTFFEAVTAIAFYYFNRQRPDFNILEVGLGGRKDATNVSQPMIPVITRIGYDHTNLLGARLANIAYEKAGIMHRQTGHQGILITIDQRPAAMKTIKQEARKTNHRLILADRVHQIKIIRADLSGTTFNIRGELGCFNAHLPMAGFHQVENLCLALAVMNELKKRGYPIAVSKIIYGLKQAHLAGRFEVLQRRPLIIYDAAHNEDSFRALRQNLHLLKGRKLYFIFGCSKDKDISYCLRYLLPRGREVILVKADHPRAMDPIAIRSRLRNRANQTIIADSVKTALAYLQTRIWSKPSIPSATVIFGSFYLYAEIKSHLQKSFIS